MKNRYLVTSIIIVLIFLAAAGGGLFYINYLKKQPPSDKNVVEAPLSQEDVINLTKPSTVRIIQHVTGKAELPDVRIDLEKLDIIPTPAVTGKSIDIDQYITGSGFVVNSDGYILTNSHVVSYQTIKNALASIKAASIVVREALLYEKSGKKVPESLNDLNAGDNAKKLAKKMVDYMVDNGKFTLEKKIVVINPSSATEDKKKMFEEGFGGSMVSVNDKYFNDQHDVALIKIDKKSLPTLELGDSSAINAGNKIYVFGFPGSADIGKSFLESSFTDGSISALKESDSKDFKLMQSDAKVSSGSSGGPMINDQGKVLGILTYASSKDMVEAGDGFAFALPISEASSWIDDYYISNELKPIQLNSTSYPSHFRKGMNYLNAKHCKQAIDEFNAAKNVDSAFSTEKYVQGYIDKCNSMITAGQSIDTGWDEKRQELAKINKLTRIFIGVGIFLLVLVIFVMLYFLEKMKKNKKEMEFMENQIMSNNNNKINTANSNINVASASAPSPAISPESSGPVKKDSSVIQTGDARITFNKKE